MKKICVRKAKFEDNHDVFSWRNDPQARLMSTDTDPVQWNKHSQWFITSLSAVNTLLLICNYSKKQTKIGMVRFDLQASLNNNVAMISINLAPSMRGQGLAKICLQQAIKYCVAINPQITQIQAIIKTSNVISQHAFKSVGFVFIHNIDDSLAIFELNTSELMTNQ